jgi:hypothetical protein
MNSDDMNYEIKSIAFWDEFTLQTIFTLPFHGSRFAPFSKFIEPMMSVLQQSTYLYDLLNIGSVVMFLGVLGWLIARLSTRSFALLVVFAICALFPLHFFYTIPQSYPVEMMYSLTFLCLAAIAIDMHLLTQTRGALLWGCVFFFIALTGNEFNPVLNAMILLCTMVARTTQQRRAFPWRVVGWLGAIVLMYVAIYVANALYHQIVLHTVSARMTPNVDPILWGSTLWLHLRASVLPIGLIDGIRLVSQNLQHEYTLPRRFTYDLFFTGQQDWWSMAVVFGVSAYAWYALIKHATVTNTLRMFMLAIACVFIFVPAGIVSTSSQYQTNFAREYQNGHVSTFHVHLGVTLLLVVFAQWIWHRKRTSLVGTLAGILILCGLAGLQTVVFRYNTTNRQLMNYSMQRWDAVNMFMTYVREKELQRSPATYVTETLQTRIAVAGVPKYPDGSPNYWTRYAQSVQQTAITFEYDKKGRQQPPALPRFEFAAQPSGDPVSFLLYPCDRDEQCLQVIALSGEPIDQVVSFDTQTTQNLTHDSWNCTEVCVATFSLQTSLEDPVPYIVLTDDSPSLLMQAIGAPFGNHTKNFGLGTP